MTEEQLLIKIDNVKNCVPEKCEYNLLGLYDFVKNSWPPSGDVPMGDVKALRYRGFKFAEDALLCIKTANIAGKKEHGDTWPWSYTECESTAILLRDHVKKYLRISGRTEV